MNYRPPSTRYEWARARYLYYGPAVVKAMWERVCRSGLADSLSQTENQSKPAQRPKRRPQAAPKSDRASRKPAPSINRTSYQRSGTGPWRHGQRVWDESKHPRAPAGRPEGGQFVDAHGGAVARPAENGDVKVEGNRERSNPRLNPPPNPNANPDFSTWEMDVAIGAMRGFWKSFYVDGIAGLPRLAFEMAKDWSEHGDTIYRLFMETLPTIGRTVGDAAGRYLADPNEAAEDLNAGRAKAEMAARTAESMLKVAMEIRRLTPYKFQKLIQCPEELEGEISDELLLLALIAKEASDELNRHFADMDAETKAYVTSYIFGMVLYEAAEAFFTRGVGTYAKSKDFGRLLKRLEDNAFIGKSPRAKAVVSKLTLKIAKLFDTQVCFVAGTKVHTPRGPVNIEDLTAGDLVFSRDEHDIDLATPIVAKPVIQPIVTHPRQLWHISLRAASGATETLVTTAAHPFFVAERFEFVAAVLLEVGQTLVLCNGGLAEVIAIHVLHAGANEVFTTYNLAIDDTRTYFVGTGGVWVHNSSHLTCEVVEQLYQRYLYKGYTDAEAKAKIWTLLQKRISSGRLSKEAAVKHWNDGNREILRRGSVDLPKFSDTEARQSKFHERDDYWPWRGLHRTEKHHPLMKGKRFRRFWKERGFTDREIEGLVKEIDTDIHRAISTPPPGGKPWWDEKLFDRIKQREKRLRKKLTKSQVMEEVNFLLDRVQEFSPAPGS